MAFISNLNINAYRGIKGLKINNLKQVNLVVGDNNCGKTSVLEAVQLLRTSGNLANVYKIARQRDALSFDNSNSIFDNFICMFPKDKNNNMKIFISGICNEKNISFNLQGVKDNILLVAKEMPRYKYNNINVPNGDVEAESFEGEITLNYDDKEKKTEVRVNQYSSVTGTSASNKDEFNIIYVAPFEHLRGSIIDKIIRSDSYKNICIRALQLFDPDIEDMMIFKSDTGNRPVEYLRHKKLGDMPISSFGDGIKKVLALSNAIAQANNGILLIDEIETAIHKKYYDDIFRFIIKACKSFNVQVFITTHSLEAIDGILATQDYDEQESNDDICVCTIKRDSDESFSRVLSGRDVYSNREAFGFEVRL